MAVRQFISMFEQKNMDERADAYDCINPYLSLLLRRKACYNKEVNNDYIYN